jgi:hypothetical protein
VLAMYWVCRGRDVVELSTLYVERNVTVQFVIVFRLMILSHNRTIVFMCQQRENSLEFVLIHY